MTRHAPVLALILSLGALAPAQGAPEPLRVDWQLPIRGQVTQTSLVRGKETTFRYRVLIEQGEGGELVVSFGDFEALKHLDQELTDPARAKQVAVESSLDFPSLRVSAYGRLLGLLDWDGHVAKLGRDMRQAKFSPQQLRRYEGFLNSEQFAQLVSLKIGERWLTWVGNWIELKLRAGDLVTVDVEVPMGAAMAPGTMTLAHAGPGEEGGVALSAVTLLEGEEATRLFRGLLEDRIRAGGERWPPDFSVADFVKTTTTQVTTDPVSLLPYEASLEARTEVTLGGEERRELERYTYRFSWDRSSPPPALPELPAAREVAPGVLCHEVEFSREGVPMTVWIYRPKGSRGKLPCVLIAPAGTYLVNGMILAEGDRPEHLPYVEAGFAVVSYSLDGPLSGEADDDDWMDAIRMFRAADAGRDNARAALDYALAKTDLIDLERIYAAGHSSAALLALQLGLADPRIKKVVAYAPAADLVAHLEPEWIQTIEGMMPGFAAWVDSVCPLQQAAQAKASTLLFYARDDETISIERGHVLADAMRKAGCSVTVEEVESGGHYQSMIDEGIPRGIRFLKGR